MAGKPLNPGTDGCPPFRFTKELKTEIAAVVVQGRHCGFSVTNRIRKKGEQGNRPLKTENVQKGICRAVLQKILQRVLFQVSQDKGVRILVHVPGRKIATCQQVPTGQKDRGREATGPAEGLNGSEVNGTAQGGSPAQGRDFLDKNR